MLAVSDVKRWLQSQWSIVAPDDWIEACLTWIHEEHAQQPLSLQQTKNAVYEQWLLSDLRELECACLPLAITQQEMYVLKGRYSLQMDSLVDVSTSYYSQLEKVTGKENANAQVSADTQATQNRWESKSNRMFMLKLTDGCLDIRAMEYEKIAVLNPTLTPGCKVQIQGEILCRLGVLMLKANNVKILGGEVESLQEENGTIKILEKALNNNVGLSDNPPETHRREFQNSTVPNRNSRASSNRQQSQAGAPGPRLGQQQRTTQYAGRQVPARNMVTESDFDDPMGIDDAELAMLDEPATTAMESEWDDDIDYEAMMDQMDSSPVESPRPSTSTANQSPKSAGLQASGRLQAGPPDPDPIDWEPDADELEAMAEMEGDSWATSRSSAMRNTDRLPHPLQASASYTERSTEAVGSKYRNVTSKLSSTGPCYSSPSFFPPAAASSSLGKSVPSSSSASRISTHLDTKPNLVRMKQEATRSAGLSHETPRVKMEMVASADSKAKTALGKQQKLDSFFNKSAVTKMEPKSEVLEIDFSPEAKKARVSRGSPSCEVIAAAPAVPLDLSSRPWTYLKYVVAAYPVQALSTVRVKGFISTLLGRLSHNEGTHWSLVVKINDGSAAVDADMADEMLTDLIGFTAAHSLVLKKQAKTDRQIRQRLSQGISTCQRTLISLSCILELQLIPNAQRPCVLRKHAVSPQDLLQLRNRVSVYN